MNAERVIAHCSDKAEAEQVLKALMSPQCPGPAKLAVTGEAKPENPIG